MSFVQKENFKMTMKKLHGFISSNCLDADAKILPRRSRVGLYFPYWTKSSVGNTVRIVGPEEDLNKLDSQKWLEDALGAAALEISSPKKISKYADQDIKFMSFKRSRLLEKNTFEARERQLRRNQKRLKEGKTTEEIDIENFKQDLLKKDPVNLSEKIVHGFEVLPKSQDRIDSHIRNRNHILIFVEKSNATEQATENTRWNSYGLALNGCVQGIPIFD